MNQSINKRIVKTIVLLCTLYAGFAAGNKTSKIISYENFVNKLASYHYTVEQGNVFVLGINECQTIITLFGGCFDNNPAAPYILLQPPVNGAYIDPHYAKSLTKLGTQGQATNIIYRLSDNDALITIVSYPPKAAYFGYQSYVFTRKISHYHNIIRPHFSIISPDPERYEIFASLGNNINNQVVQNQIAASPWNGKVVIYVTTSNQEIVNDILELAKTNNIDQRSIFIEPIGSNVITGRESDADDMSTLIRYAIPESTADSAKWFANIDKNILVYRISNASAKVNRFGENKYTPRSGTTEEIFLKYALDYVARLLQEYLTTIQNPDEIVVKTSIITTLDTIEGIPHGLVGADCLRTGRICAGDDQDTSTYAIKKIQMLTGNRNIFIVGVNHNTLNNSSYISVGVYDANQMLGVDSLSQTNPNAVGFNSGILTGSAEKVLNSLGIKYPASIKSALSHLYIALVSRDCNQSYIKPAQKYCIDVSKRIPIQNAISISERSYLQPGSTTGGNVNVMLYPRIIASKEHF